MRSRIPPAFAVVAALALVFTISTQRARAAGAASAALEWMEAVPAALSADVLAVKVAAPFTVVPTRLTSATLASGSWTEFPGTDIALGFQKDDVMQQVIATNCDASAKLCVDFVPRVDADCATECSGDANTCTGSGAGDASYVLPGTFRPFTPAGSLCICVRGTAAMCAQLEEIVR